MPSRQRWFDPNTQAVQLDTSGNWAKMDYRIGSSTATQTRKLANSSLNPENPDGWKMNEIARLDVRIGNQHSIERLTYDAAGNLVATVLYGDMNRDGVVSYADSNAFALSVTDPNSYAVHYPDCDIMLGDVNGDGVISYADINAYI
jgi:hypothetical protein